MLLGELGSSQILTTKATLIMPLTIAAAIVEPTDPGYTFLFRVSSSASHIVQPNSAAATGQRSLPQTAHSQAYTADS